MTTATVTPTRMGSAHAAPMTPAQIRAQRRAMTLTKAELTHEHDVYSADPTGGSASELLNVTGATLDWVCAGLQ